MEVIDLKYARAVFLSRPPKVVVTPHPLVHKMHPTTANSLNLMAVMLQRGNAVSDVPASRDTGTTRKQLLYHVINPFFRSKPSILGQPLIKHGNFSLITGNYKSNVINYIQ